MNKIIRNRAGLLMVQWEVREITIGVETFQLSYLIGRTDPELRDLVQYLIPAEHRETTEAELISLLYEFGRV